METDLRDLRSTRDERPPRKRLRNPRYFVLGTYRKRFCQIPQENNSQRVDPLRNSAVLGLQPHLTKCARMQFFYLFFKFVLFSTIGKLVAEWNRSSWVEL